MKREYRSAMGISVGDLVTMCRDDRPLEVWGISGPRYLSKFVGVWVVRTWPVISLICIWPGNENPRAVIGGNDGFYFINDIRREGDRWFDDSNEEIFVTPASEPPALPMPMFPPPYPEPYPFQPGVDYSSDVWHCDQCGQDFNAPQTDRYARPWHCPGGPTTQIILMKPRPPVGQGKPLNAYLLSIGCQEEVSEL